MLHQTRHFRWLLDLLISAYAALLVVTWQGINENPLRLVYPLLCAYSLLADLLGWTRFSPGARRHWVILGWSLWCLLAVVVFGGLHLFRRIPLIRLLSRCVTGAVAVVGFPLAWLMSRVVRLDSPARAGDEQRR